MSIFMQLADSRIFAQLAGLSYLKGFHLAVERIETENLLVLSEIHVFPHSLSALTLHTSPTCPQPPP